MSSYVSRIGHVADSTSDLVRAFFRRLRGHLGRRDRRAATCLFVFLAVAVALGVRPVHRPTWILENIPTVFFVGLCIATYKRFRFSDRAYVQGLIFLVFHSIGSHYTYARMPVGLWLKAQLHLERNPYDRLVHFLFGLLLFLAAEELFVRGVQRWRRHFLAFTVIAWWALAYELVEWTVAAIVAPGQGLAFLAAQGDVWDAHKDMGLACVGALLAWGYEAIRPRGKKASASRSATL